MAENKFNGTVEALFHGMDSVITSKTVVGEAIHINVTECSPCYSEWYNKTCEH